jgi:hypothetical protein
MHAARTPIHRGKAPRRPRPALGVLGVRVLTAILIALLVDRIFFQSSTSPAGTGSGVAATQARSLPPFTGVDLVGESNVTVQVGARQSVRVHADSNLLSRVTTRVRSGRLMIGTTPGRLNAKSPMFVAVSLPSLDGIRLQGEGNISASGIDSQSLTAELSGSGNIDAGGTAARLDVTISGAGNALLRRLSARDAKAELSGSGSIMLTATQSLTARVSGSGTVLYGGNPRHVTQTVTGSGTISAG